MSDEFDINEYLLDENTHLKALLKASQWNLAAVMQRHEGILNTLVDVCRRNDRMQVAGECLRTLLEDYDLAGDILVGEAIQKWTEANV